MAETPMPETPGTHEVFATVPLAAGRREKHAGAGESKRFDVVLGGCHQPELFA